MTPIQGEQEVSADFTEKVKAEQIRLLYRQAPSTLVLGYLAAVVGVALLWDVANHMSLLV